MKQYTQEEFNNFARDELGYLQCPSGDYRLIKEFPAYCSFGECCSFGGWCRFGEDCSFGEGCTCEEEYKFKSVFTAGYLGSREGQTYFWLLKDGNILVRCGCFCGMIDDFAKQVEEEHGDNVHGRMYRLAIEMARLKAGSLS